MTRPLNVLAPLFLTALLAGCVGAGGGIDSRADLEQTLNEDLDGDGNVPNNLGRDTSVPDT
ncbi:MAG: hypothetical protein AAF366_05080 [Pseudomonadota bacterium]